MKPAKRSLNGIVLSVYAVYYTVPVAGDTGITNTRHVFLPRRATVYLVVVDFDVATGNASGAQLSRSS